MNIQPSRTSVKVKPVAQKVFKKPPIEYLSKKNIQLLGIFLVFLAGLSLLFMVMSNRRAPRIISKSKPLVINDFDIDSVDEEENMFESLDFQRVHTEYQTAYLDLINSITTRAPMKGSEDNTVEVDIRNDILLFENFRTAQNNYSKALKRIEEHEKKYKKLCFGRMRKLILAVLQADKKLGKRVTRFDSEKLIEMGALDEMPVCPRNGEYSIIYKNDRRLFNCSVHGILKN